jgi:hypothetical protein
MNFSLSEKERSFAERLRADAWRAVKETDARTRNRQNDITKKLGTHNYGKVIEIMFRVVVLYANKCKHVLKTGFVCTKTEHIFQSVSVICVLYFGV